MDTVHSSPGHSKALTRAAPLTGPPTTQDKSSNKSKVRTYLRSLIPTSHLPASSQTSAFPFWRKVTSIVEPTHLRKLTVDACVKNTGCIPGHFPRDPPVAYEQGRWTLPEKYRAHRTGGYPSADIFDEDSDDADSGEDSDRAYVDCASRLRTKEASANPQPPPLPPRQAVKHVLVRHPVRQVIVRKQDKKRADPSRESPYHQLLENLQKFAGNDKITIRPGPRVAVATQIHKPVPVPQACAAVFENMDDDTDEEFESVATYGSSVLRWTAAGGEARSEARNLGQRRSIKPSRLESLLTLQLRKADVSEDTESLITLVSPVAEEIESESPVSPLDDSDMQGPLADIAREAALLSAAALDVFVHTLDVCGE